MECETGTMDYPDRIKSIIYEQLLHFSHLHEQRMELELKEIQEMVQLHQLKGVPGNLSTIHVLIASANMNRSIIPRLPKN